MSGTQLGSGAVSGLPSVSAIGIEVAGRHVTSTGMAAPENRVLLKS